MNIIRSIQKNYKIYTSASLFLITSLLVAYLFPKERKFAYEFNKGRRWVHEDLYAQFSFPLHKSEEQIKLQRDSVIRNVKMCYSFDARVIESQLQGFKNRFNKGWIKFSLDEFRIKDEEIYLQSQRYENHRKLQEIYTTFIDTLYQKVYYKGIIQLYEVAEKNQESIILVKGNIAEEIDSDQLYTLRTAYEFISGRIDNELMTQNYGLPVRYRNFIRDYDFNRHLMANVNFDDEITENLLKSEKEKISETEGLIEQGEMIIAENEFVTPEKLRILESYKIEFEKYEGNVGNVMVRMGKLLLVLVCFFVMFMFLYNFRREIIYQTLKTSFILIMVLIMMFVATAVSKFGNISYYIVPFTILPILIRTFYDERVALFIHINTILMAALVAPKGFEFIFLNIIAGIVAIFSLTNLYRRSRFFLSAIFVGLAYAITYFGIAVVQGGDFSFLELKYFRDFGINSVLVLSSFLLIYIAEKVFGFLSDTTLMELADTNQSLLRKLSEVAPGTFQHSLQVANLAEAAIMKIGGNPLLIRTGAMYHDIGKMEEPAYYIENQTHGFNPHDFLEFKDSAEKIISHVIKGEEMARKNKLPEPIIDFIRTHHGTTTVQYFYKSYIKKYPEREDEVEQFTYPGPKPFSKETAVLMMADAVEAASRSLPEYTEETIGKLVDKIVSVQRKAGQFDDADITFKDLTTVKDIFKARLRNMYHVRISYPK